MQSFIQSEAWEAFQRAAGAEVRREDGTLFIRRSLPAGGSYWQSSRPSFSTFSLPDFASESWFLRMEPEDAASHAVLKECAVNNIKKLVPTLAIQPRQTSIVDIASSYEEIVKSMKQKHRYNIKVAEKHGVKTEAFSENLEMPFERFWSLLETTSERHSFRTHGKEYYLTMLRELQKHDMAHVVLASKDSQDLAGMILITHHETATYLHGGSTHAHKELMSPYLLHAHAIRLAKGKGCDKYDLWGTHLMRTDDEWKPIERHPSAGVSRFKLGFGGTIVEYPGAFDLILKPFWYTPYQLGRTLLTGKRDFA